MKRLMLLGILFVTFGCSTLSAGIYDLAFDPNVWQWNKTTINGEPIGSYPMFFNDSKTSNIWLWCMTYQISQDYNFFRVTINTQDYGAQAYVVSMLGRPYSAEVIQWTLWLLDIKHTINGKTASAFLNGADKDIYPWVNDVFALAAYAKLHPLTPGSYEVFIDTTGKYQDMIHVVPEPALILLLGIGVFTYCLFAARRNM
jgi:hypothetical protein